MKATHACLLAAGALASPRAAHACGVSGSGAPAGICDASEVLDEKSAASRNRVGVSYGFTSSVLYFSDGTRAPTERHAVTASFEHPMPGRWTLELAAGSLLAGNLGPAQFSPGVLAAASLSHLIVPPRGRYVAPFLLTSFTIAGVWAETTQGGGHQETDYVALDFAFSVAAGMSYKHVTPFIVGRLYGGPVFWRNTTASAPEPVIGSDAYHYALGPGVAVSLARSRIGISLGASLLGEKNIKAGASVAF